LAARNIACEAPHTTLIRQFRETPFGLTPDPQFFYFNPIYREALATLADGFESRKGLMVITGEPGTGKPLC
jgi:general secretion pathway protein A